MEIDITWYVTKCVAAGSESWGTDGVSIGAGNKMEVIYSSRDGCVGEPNFLILLRYYLAVADPGFPVGGACTC